MAARPGSLGAHIEAANKDPERIARFTALLARYAAGSRTVRQLTATRDHFGLPSALAFTPGSECAECGAIPGFVHEAGCATDRHPELAANPIMLTGPGQYAAVR